ncbi:hypothetical protein LIER_00592 [Lithospermum erythrorhizon]|uniref:Uncharacterized protein n=1 Tax=Lithospermum erythrorhizon TaxID=34254 RepID=A0AAV3NIQ7_LITER
MQIFVDLKTKRSSSLPKESSMRPGGVVQEKEMKAKERAGSFDFACFSRACLREGLESFSLGPKAFQKI